MDKIGGQPVYYEQQQVYIRIFISGCSRSCVGIKANNSYVIRTKRGCVKTMNKILEGEGSNELTY